MINNTNWSGALTLDNLDEVAEAIRERLEGQTYTFITRDQGFRETRRKHQELCPWKSRDRKKAVFTDREGDWGMIDVVDTYGSWGTSTYADATITFTAQGFLIDQKAPAGNALHWEILIE